MAHAESKIRNSTSNIVLGLYDGEALGIRLFVRARRLLAPLEEIATFVPPQGDALDVGCGHGLFSLMLALASPDRRVVGVDPSPAKIEVAHRAGQPVANAGFLLGTVEAVGPDGPGRSQDGLFRVITVLDVLYLLPPEEKLRVLRGCRQVIAPDGVLLMKTNDTHPAWKYAATRLQEWAMTTSGLTLGHGGLYFASCEENRALLREAGFQAEVVHLRHWTPYPHVLFIARTANRGRPTAEDVDVAPQGRGGGGDAGGRVTRRRSAVLRQPQDERGGLSQEP